MHDDDKRRHAGEYLNRLETKAGLYRFLRDYNGGLPLPAERSTACISDKACFTARCRKFNIAIAPVLLSVDKGEVTVVDWRGPGLPEVDLFVKAVRGRGGNNATRWSYQVQGDISVTMGKWLLEISYLSVCGKRHGAELF